MNFLKSGRFLLFCAVFLPFLILSSMRLALLPEGHETSTDSYWHVYAADRPVSQMIAKKYPITMSIWRDHFADKELLFHGVLKLWTTGKHLLKQSITPPFNGASVLIMFLFFCAFVFASHQCGIPPGLTLLCSLGTILVAPTFTYRLLMVRPHVLAMVLILTAFGILAKGPQKKKTALLVFLCAFAMAWTYSSPHLIWVEAFLFGMAWFPQEKWKAFASFPASVLGVFAGLTIHPQFPNSLMLWKVQAVDALIAPVSGNVLTIPYAQELSLQSFRWLQISSPVLVLLYFMVMILFRRVEMQGLKKVNPLLTAGVLTAGFWSAAFLFICARPIEHAVPALMLTAGIALPEACAPGAFRFCKRMRNPVLLLSLFLCLAGSRSMFICCDSLHNFTKSAPFALVQELRKLAVPEERVVNIDWSGFPILTQMAPEFEYTWGLDPMFSYAADPKRTCELGALTMLRKHVPSRFIGERFQARYAVVLNGEILAGQYLQKQCGWHVLYYGPDGWIFSLE